MLLEGDRLLLNKLLKASCKFWGRHAGSNASLFNSSRCSRLTVEIIVDEKSSVSLAWRKRTLTLSLRFDAENLQLIENWFPCIVLVAL